MVVGARSAEVVDFAEEKLGGLDIGHSVEGGDLVEAAVRRPLGGGPVVADDVDDQRVVEDPDFFEGVDEPAHFVVGVL